MNTYEIRYVTENGFIENVFIDAVNSVTARGEFDNMSKDFDDKVICSNCFLVEENWTIKDAKSLLRGTLSHEIKAVSRNVKSLEAQLNGNYPISENEKKDLLDIISKWNDYIRVLRVFDRKIEKEEIL